MLGFETIRGIRVVAEPAVLDALVVVEGTLVLRLAPDDAFVVSPSPDGGLDADASKTIVVEETAFVGCWLTPAQLAGQVIPHMDWVLPEARPALAQGFVAGVPSKLWLEADRALLLCAAPYAHELAERLG